MTDKKYSLRLTYMTEAMFDDVKDDGVHVIVPINMYGEFERISTHHDVQVTGDSFAKDFEDVRARYKDMDVFCLDAECSPENNQMTFTVSREPSQVVAFVCVPRDETFYKEDPDAFLEYIAVALENQYNNVNAWIIDVMDCDDESVESVNIYYDPENQEDKQWFEMCREKYGITDDQIAAAQNIMHAQKYRITSDMYEI